MRVYLLNPSFVKGFVRCGRWQGATARGGTLDYPKWLAYTAGILEKEGNTVRLKDAIASKLSEDDVINDVLDFNPEIIVVESNFSSLNNDIGIVRSIKERFHKEVLTVLIGPPTAVYPDKILENRSIDIIARFEPDFIIRDLIAAIENGNDLKTVDGIWFREDNKIIRNKERKFSTSDDLNDLPFVSSVYKKHLNIYDYYLSQSLYPEVQIFTGRGCPFRCSFCSWPENLMGRTVRLRSAESIVNEFQYISNNLPEVKEIFLEDDTFTLDKERVRQFCQNILKRKINIKWSCNARADLDYDTLLLMKKAGCRLLIVGYETGSDEILLTIRKGITTEKAKKFTLNAKKAGLLIHADFIIGLPGETHNSAQQTLDYIREIKPDVLQVAIATPIPGTEFYNFVQKNGYLLVDDMTQSIDEYGFQKCIVSYPDFTKHDIEQWVNKILKKYYLSPSYFFTFIHGIVNGGGINHAKCVLRAGNDFLRYITKFEGT